MIWTYPDRRDAPTRCTSNLLLFNNNLRPSIPKFRLPEDIIGEQKLPKMILMAKLAHAAHRGSNHSTSGCSVEISNSPFKDSLTPGSSSLSSANVYSSPLPFSSGFPCQTSLAFYLSSTFCFLLTMPRAQASTQYV